MEQKEIARQVGVSPAVVSMVLRGQGRVSQAKREEILALAQKHQVGVRKFSKRVEAEPSARIRRLAYCGIQHRLGWFHIGTFSSLNEPLLGMSYDISLLLAEGDDASAAETARTFHDRLPGMQLDGLIIGPHDAVAEALEGHHLPTVHVRYHNDRDDRDAVLPDNFSGAQRLAAGVAARGRRRIAVLRCLSREPNSGEKFAGFRSAIEAAGLQLDPALVLEGDCLYQAGAKLAARLCQAPGPPPDAILFENDWHAPEFAQYLRQHLPADWPAIQELDLAMFCDSERENYLTVPIDRVLLPRADMGRLAVRRLLEHLAHPHDWRPHTLRVSPAYQPAARG